MCSPEHVPFVVVSMSVLALFLKKLLDIGICICSFGIFLHHYQIDGMIQNPGLDAKSSIILCDIMLPPPNIPFLSLFYESCVCVNVPVFETAQKT